MSRKKAAGVCTPGGSCPSRLESGGRTYASAFAIGQVPGINLRNREAAAAPSGACEMHPPRKPELFLPTADRLACDIELPTNIRDGVVIVHSGDLL